MKAKLTVLAATLLLSLGASQVVQASSLPSRLLQNPLAAKNLLMPKEKISAAVLVVWENGRKNLSLRSKKLPGGASVVFPSGESAASLATRLEKNPAVLSADVNVPVRALSLSQDSWSGRQWGLENRGFYFASNPTESTWRQTRRAVRDADIDASAAWRAEQGSSQTVVAVVDSGVAYDGKDIDENIWQNTDEVAGNGADDDGNGYTDDTLGWNFSDQSNDPFDAMGHGTHVASAIAAEKDNGRAISGVAPGATVMPVQVFDAWGRGDAVELWYGINYAIDNGAKIVNLSLSYGNQEVEAFEILVRDHPEVLFVAAAGNEGADNDQLPNYPCNIDAANVICVGSSGPSDNISSFSNRGPASVDIAAPGESILGLAPGFFGCPDSSRFSASQCSSQYLAHGFTDSSTSEWDSWSKGGEWGLWGGHPLRAIYKNWQTISDSPEGNYSANSDSWAISPDESLEEASGCIFRGLYSGETEEGADIFTVDYSSDGSSYQTLFSLSGQLDRPDAWLGEFPTYVWSRGLGREMEGLGQTNFRYRLQSNGSVEKSGVDIFFTTLTCEGPLSVAQILDGTSMATPHVSGVAALLLSQSPDASPLEIRRAIMQGSDKKRKLRGKVAMGRRLNAAGALRALDR